MLAMQLTAAKTFPKGKVFNEGRRTLVERSLSANQSTLVFSEPATNRPQSTLEMPVPVPQIFQYDYVPETKEDLDWADRESALFSFSSCKRTD